MEMIFVVMSANNKINSTAFTEYLKAIWKFFQNMILMPAMPDTTIRQNPHYLIYLGKLQKHRGTQANLKHVNLDSHNNTFLNL